MSDLRQEVTHTVLVVHAIHVRKSVDMQGNAVEILVVTPCTHCPEHFNSNAQPHNPPQMLQKPHRMKKPQLLRVDPLQACIVPPLQVLNVRDKLGVDFFSARNAG